MSKFLVWSVIWLTFFFPASQTIAASQNNCQVCHTHEGVLKVLFKPPTVQAGEGEKYTGTPPPVKTEEMYKRFLVDKKLIGKDRHFAMGCQFCHKGNQAGKDKEAAHTGLVKRPSDNMQTCRICHKQIADFYEKSLHYTTIGQRHGVMKRFSASELKQFDAKVFEQSCRSCHASCGDCHVKSPTIGGVSAGFIQGHKFVKRDEEKTCAFCHGGGVYAEFTGKYEGQPDVHYQKGKKCFDCHKKDELHGDGNSYLSKNDVKNRPSCKNCHQLGKEKKLTAKLSHEKHKDKVSCYGCHASENYRNCYDCHMEKGSHSKPGFLLGLSPRDKKKLTTLRVIPTVRNTFEKVGIKMEQYDALPNYHAAPIHNIKKRTERTRTCDTCHVDRSGFLTKEQLIPDGSQMNEKLIMTPKPIR